MPLAKRYSNVNVLSFNKIKSQWSLDQVWMSSIVQGKRAGRTNHFEHDLVDWITSPGQLLRLKIIFMIQVSMFWCVFNSLHENGTITSYCIIALQRAFESQENFENMFLKICRKKLTFHVIAFLEKIMLVAHHNRHVVLQSYLKLAFQKKYRKFWKLFSFVIIILRIFHTYTWIPHTHTFIYIPI